MREFSLCAFFLLGSALGSLCDGGICAQSVPEKQSEQHYLWARLTSKVDIAALKQGDVVAARSSDSWTTSHCYVRPGTILQGTVLQVRAAEAGKGRAVVLGFTAACTEGRTVQVTLVAALYPKEDESRDQMQTYMAMPSGLGTGASGRQSTDLSRVPSPGSETPQPPRVKVGQVSGIRHLKLRFVSDAPAQSVLFVMDERLRLSEGTRLAFRLSTE